MIMRAGARVTPVVVTPAKLSKLMSDGNGDLVTGERKCPAGLGIRGERCRQRPRGLERRSPQRR